MDGDGVADLILQKATGELFTWFLNANGSLKGGYYTRSTPMSWYVRTVTDVNGDGATDLILQDAGGRVIVWFLNGTGVISSWKYTSTATSSWLIRGAGR